MKVSAEAYGRRNLSLSVGRSVLVLLVAAIPVPAALEVMSGVGGWGLLAVLAAYVLGACLGVDTGRRSVAGGLSAARRATVWLLLRGDARGLIALVLFGLGGWVFIELVRSAVLLSALIESWPMTGNLADQHAQARALQGLIASISEVGATAWVRVVVVICVGLLGMFWSGALDGIWLGSAASRTGVSWWRLLSELRGWQEWARGREERRRAYWGAAG